MIELPIVKRVLHPDPFGEKLISRTITGILNQIFRNPVSKALSKI
jgi:hypothetical protein